MVKLLPLDFIFIVLLDVLLGELQDLKNPLKMNYYIKLRARELGDLIVMDFLEAHKVYKKKFLTQ
jgi:hypothetical protein